MSTRNAPSPELREARSRAGQIGSARRWGPPRVIRLDDLAPEQRQFIVELVAVAKRNAPRPPTTPEAA